MDCLLPVQLEIVSNACALADRRARVQTPLVSVIYLFLFYSQKSEVESRAIIGRFADFDILFY